jgi:BetI-type transcriptional repressor, C-terminal
VKDRVARETTALAKLRAYVAANFEFMKAHRVGYVALVDLWGQRDAAGERNPLNADAYEPSRHYLAHILEEGRKTGELRAVPVRTTASILQAAIDGVMLQWVFDENAIDLDVARDEVTEMVTSYVKPLAEKGESR